MNRIEELIDAASSAVDEQRLERAQPLAQIATAQALASIAESLARIASTVGNVSFDPQQPINAVRTSPWQ